MDIQFSEHHILERSLFPHRSVLASLSKNQFTINVRVYFLTQNSVPWIYRSIFMWVPRYLNYCSFLVNLKTGNCESTNFAFFKIALSILWLLPFHMNFRISLSTSAKKEVGLWWGLCWLHRAVGGCCYLDSITSSGPWTGVSFHLFSSLISLKNVL